MRVLAIIGSHRKANTYNVVKKVEEKIKQSMVFDFEYIFLKDVNLKNCIGCFQCIQKGHEFCPLDDDYKNILDKMNNSDGIILATPAYNFNITPLMMNFITRSAYNGHRPQFFKQHLMIIVTTAGIGISNVSKYLTEYVGKYWGFRTITKLGLLVTPYQRPEIQINNDIKKIAKTTTSFLGKLHLKSWKPHFNHILQFCTLRALWSLEEMKEAFPKDNKLYNSLKKKRYFYDINVNTFIYTVSCIYAEFIKILVKNTIKHEN
jgi:multimeric flavodoxin WrbA/mRNA-degrading endonuclease HigB of HigAB toxin-antitoxin module